MKDEWVGAKALRGLKPALQTGGRNRVISGECFR